MDLTKVDELKLNSKLTTHYPILIGSAPACGKSHSLINLTDEEKAVTVVINADGKALGDISKYAKVITLDSNFGKGYKNIISIDSRLKESFKTFLQILEEIKQGTKIQRLVVDTFTSLISWFLRIAEKQSGYTVWSTYNSQIDQFIKTIQNYSVHKKAVYVFAHYRPSFDGKAFITVKGSEHKDLVEAYFSTTILANKTDSGGKRRFFYYADTLNDDDTTRTSVKGSRLSFARYSLTSLEDYLFADTKEERLAVKKLAEEKTAKDLENSDEEELFERF